MRLGSAASAGYLVAASRGGELAMRKRLAMARATSSRPPREREQSMTSAFAELMSTRIWSSAFSVAARSFFEVGMRAYIPNWAMLR